MNDGSQDWDFEVPPGKAKPKNSRRRLIIIVLGIALIIVLSLGVYVVSQTWDLWFVDSGVVISEFDQTATSSCASFIAEFPGTPCPP